MDTIVDAGQYYALLRFEEAALALRATLQLNLIDRIDDRRFESGELRQMLGFTEQAARTFFAKLDSSIRIVRLSA